MTAIYNGLYIGDINDASSKEFMYAKPTAILNCAKEVPKSPYAVAYLHLPLDDVPTEQISPYFATANEYIDTYLNKGYNVLVHCFAGISRSASFVIAYLMHKYGMSFLEAYAYVKNKRSVIDPNIGFIYQLQAYEG